MGEPGQILGEKGKMQQELGLGACGVETETDKENCLFDLQNVSFSWIAYVPAVQVRGAWLACFSETRGRLDEHDAVALSEHDGGLKMIYSYPLNL